ncbi:hypothetical protein [Streptomyces liangshanensis]|uniref:hypothetical protein n=1 Tax=Streptomyces liangshanensis TaxID=2717324 RepID=UPI0036D90B5E
MDLIERPVVRCAEGHVFRASAFPMQQLDAGRIGPGRLIRCPRCARLRHAVPVGVVEEVAPPVVGDGVGVGVGIVGI